MDIGIAGITIAIILGTCSIVSSIVFGYIPRKRQQELIQTKKELIQTKNALLQLYKDVSKLLEVEHQLLDEADMSKIEARRGQDISYRCEPTRVRKRINELSAQLKSYENINEL